MKSLWQRLSDEFGGWKHLNPRNIVRKVNTYTAYRRCTELAVKHRKTLIKRMIRSERWGSDFGGWIVPLDYLPQNALCYCAGVGEDTTFDELLLKAGCTVYAFDPTPRAAQHVERRKAQLGPRFHFTPVGIWSEEKTLRLAIHADPNVESCSVLPIITNGQYHEVLCKSVPQIIKEFGHPLPDLLKLDIEGAEHEAVKSLLASSVTPRIVMIDFDVPVPPARIENTVSSLLAHGYELVAIDGLNYVFVRHPESPLPAAKAA